MEELNELERLVHAYEIHRELSKNDKKQLRKGDVKRMIKSHPAHQSLSASHNLEAGECERLVQVCFSLILIFIIFF